MYVHEIAIKNYSVHQKSKFVLHPITVLVGPNGGGKSAFFDALLNFSMLARGNIGQAFGPWPYSFAATRYRGAPSIGRIEFDITLSETQTSERLRYSIDYSQQTGPEPDAPSFEIHAETLKQLPAGEILFERNDPESSRLPAATKFLGSDTGIFAAVRRAIQSGTSEFPPIVAACSRDISRFAKFRLEPQNLAAPSELPDLERSAPRLAYDGTNLAGTLYFLHETSDPSLAKIATRLRSVRGFENFEEFEFNTVGALRIGFSVRFGDARRSVAAPRLSDGQRLLIGLMALICGPAPPPILLLEEPENGLTALAARAVYTAVRALALSDTEARSQVLISSHSPFVLCEAWNGEDRGFVLQMKVEGGRAVVRSFADAVDAAGSVLSKTSDGRTHLGLTNAEEIMSGYLA